MSEKNKLISLANSGPLSKKEIMATTINYFVEMGYSEQLVLKVIEENGEGNHELILNTLLAYSVLEGDSPEQLMSTNPNTIDLSDVDSWSEDMLEGDISDSGCMSEKNKLISLANSRSLSKKETMATTINYFVEMGYSEKLVLKVIEENGEGNHELILNTLLTYSVLEGDSPEQLVSTSPNTMDLSDVDSWSEDELEGGCMSEKNKLISLANSGSLSKKEKKILDLANMGYTVEEASIAVERCGAEASLFLLKDFVSAAQFAREEDCHLPEDDLKRKRLDEGSSSSKKRKPNPKLKNRAETEEFIRLPIPMIGFGVPDQSADSALIPLSVPDAARGPPFFYYENVANTPKGVWDTISRFLFDIKPEFVDSKYFSVAARKRGYIHNLPIENRFPLVPLPPLTIQEAFPLSRQWWPSWDKRKKLNCIQTVTGSAANTGRIREALEMSDGDPPESVKMFVLDECRKWNLVWVGKNKLAPLEPDEVEMLLGFPKNHTRGGGISRTDRYKSLGNSFQVDTVAYHFSVLKDMFPKGINVLSLFSGIGGAEVALHRLGIKLKNVVSVEKSKVNRDIVRSWWEQTNQSGILIDFDDVRMIDAERLENIIGSIGGFDLVVGGSPCNNLAGSNRVSRNGLEGTESSLFYDYFRILDLVKNIMGKCRSN